MKEENTEWMEEVAAADIPGSKPEKFRHYQNTVYYHQKGKKDKIIKAWRNKSAILKGMVSRDFCLLFFLTADKTNFSR